MIGQTTPDPASSTTAEKGTTATTERGGGEAEAVAGDTRIVEEFGGRDGPDPTRFGDWEKNGRCMDF